MINPWRKIIAVFRLIDDVKFLRRRMTVMSRNLSDLNLIYNTESEIKEAIRDYEALRVKIDGYDGWDHEILALKDELKRREMMKREMKTKLTSMDKSEQRNDETQTHEGFSKLTECDPLDTFALKNRTHL